jgi:hypothetical protein
MFPDETIHDSRLKSSHRSAPVWPTTLHIVYIGLTIIVDPENWTGC